MTDLFFWLGTTGGSGILLLLAGTSVAIITFFARNPHDENVWSRLIAPALAMILLTGIVVLAVLYYGILLGVPAGSPAARALPGLYVVITGIGLAWGLILVRAFHTGQSGSRSPAACGQRYGLPAQGHQARNCRWCGYGRQRPVNWRT
jgi:hypothetical protein